MTTSSKERSRAAGDEAKDETGKMSGVRQEQIRRKERITRNETMYKRKRKTQAEEDTLNPEEHWSTNTKHDKNYFQSPNSRASGEHHQTNYLLLLSCLVSWSHLSKQNETDESNGNCHKVSGLPVKQLQEIAASAVVDKFNHITEDETHPLHMHIVFNKSGRVRLLKVRTNRSHTCHDIV